MGLVVVLLPDGVAGELRRDGHHRSFGAGELCEAAATTTTHLPRASRRGRALPLLHGSTTSARDPATCSTGARRPSRVPGAEQLETTTSFLCKVSMTRPTRFYDPDDKSGHQVLFFPGFYDRINKIV